MDGVSFSQIGEGFGEGAVFPFPENFSIFELW